MKSLYRRYRPVTLDEVVGQEQVTAPLMKSLEQGKINHAYLFVGPRGCGKTSVARILAHQINGFDYTIEDEYVDIIEIDGASNRGIENIRELREKAAIAPTMGKYKVYIIDEVHMLTKEAFNALLKTLEEPPAHVVFIMATTDAYKVPVTITSRSQTFTFRLSTPDIMLDFLKSVAKKEKIKIDDDALETIARRGGGSFRDSLSLLDQISTLSNTKITKELVVSVLGLAEDEKIAELLNIYVSHDNVKLTSEIRELFATGIKPETIAEEMIRQIVEAPSPELLPLLEKLPEIKSPYAEAKLLVALLMDETNATRSALAQPVRATQPISSANSTRPSNAAKPEPKAASPAPQQSKQKPAASQSNIPGGDGAPFDWQAFLDRIKAISGGVHMKIAKAEHFFDGSTLHIYIKHKPAFNYLSQDKIKGMLHQATQPNVKITIENGENSPNNIQNGGLINNISDIMGGEVIDDGGGSPF